MLDDTNIRFKTLRESCKKSQEDFGKALGLSKSGISEIENGRRNVTDQHIIMLRNWSEFNVNTDWLRTGEGEMFIQMDRETELSVWAGKLLKPSNDGSFQQRFVHMLSKLDEADWKALEKMALLMEAENTKD